MLRCGSFSTSCIRGWLGGPCSHWAPQLPAQTEEAEPMFLCSLAPLPSQVFLPGPLAGWGLCGRGGRGRGSSVCWCPQCCHQAWSPARRWRVRLCAMHLYPWCVLIPRKGGVLKSHLHSQQWKRWKERNGMELGVSKGAAAPQTSSGSRWHTGGLAVNEKRSLWADTTSQVQVLSLTHCL